MIFGPQDSGLDWDFWNNRLRNAQDGFESALQKLFSCSQVYFLSSIFKYCLLIDGMKEKEFEILKCYTRNFFNNHNPQLWYNSNILLIFSTLSVNFIGRNHIRFFFESGFSLRSDPDHLRLDPQPCWNTERSWRQILKIYIFPWLCSRPWLIFPLYMAPTLCTVIAVFVFALPRQNIFSIP